MGKRTGAFAAALFLAFILSPLFPSTVKAQPLPRATVPEYTVTFESGKHGTFDPAGARAIQTIPYGRAATAPTVIPEKAYNFTGWDKAFDRITQDTTVTAQYTIKTFTVRFDPGEHGEFTDGAKRVQTVPYGSGATAPGVKAEEGYGFAGWDQGYDQVTGNMTVTALYFRRTCTVRFEPGAHGTLSPGSAPPVQAVPYGEKATAPEVIPDGGYIFTGWDGAYERITADTTLHALYEIKEYTVDVRIQGSGRITGIEGTYGYGTTLDLMKDVPTPDGGYAFVRYEDAYGNAITQLQVTKDTTITAVFRKTAEGQANAQIGEDKLPLAGNGMIQDLMSKDYVYIIAGSIALLLLILFILLFARRKRAEGQPKYSYRFPIYRMLYRKKPDKE